MEEYALSRRLFVRASAYMLAGSALASRASAPAALPATTTAPAQRETAAAALAADADFRCEIVRRETTELVPSGVSVTAP